MVFSAQPRIDSVRKTPNLVQCSHVGHCAEEIYIAQRIFVPDVQRLHAKSAIVNIKHNIIYAT